MNNEELLLVLKEHYELKISHIELFREGGNSTYIVEAEKSKFFLKCVDPAFADTIVTSIDVNLYLSRKSFSVPEIILTTDKKEPYVIYHSYLIIVYEYLQTTEIDMEKDAEEVGLLIGQMHSLMKDYPGQLVKRGKNFYIKRYIDILQKKHYSKVDEFVTIGEHIWDRVSKLPYGYSHGDMYCGNIERGKDGKLYILDFDTSCIGFQLYDLALICNQTDYFQYKEDGLPKTLSIYRRLLPEYQKTHKLSGCEESSLCDIILLYHFALQATIIEINGLDCVDYAFLDNQLVWLKHFKELYESRFSK